MYIKILKVCEPNMITSNENFAYLSFASGNKILERTKLESKKSKYLDDNIQNVKTVSILSSDSSVT